MNFVLLNVSPYFKLYILNRLLIFALLNVQVLISQSNLVDERILAVENHLMSRSQYLDTTYNYRTVTANGFNLTERMQYYNIPAVAIAVIYNGKIDWCKAYGYSDLELKVPVTAQTRFNVASISKSLNATCVFKLVEQGKLSLDKDIRDYLKTWTFPDNKYSMGKKITLANLLSHTAGTSVHGFDDYKPGQKVPTLNEMLDGKKPAINRSVKPIAYPNDNCIYSGGGVLISRKILEDNVAPNYDSLITEVVLKPMEMKSSTFRQITSSTFQNDLAPGYVKKKKLKGNYRTYPELAPDGLWTTAEDLARFVLSIEMAANTNDGLLSRALVERMLAPVGKYNDIDFSMGFFIKDVGTDKFFFHDGANLGYTAIFLGSVTSDVGVVILTNSDQQFEFMNEILRSVECVYKWRSYKKW
jgi:CubicO group peptidase (beta-lactamase class C family)